MVRQKHPPLRRCVGCGEKTSKHQLIRLVHTPEGTVEVDPTGRKPGRGAYLCQREACWRRGIERPERLERALRATIPQEKRESLAQAMQALGQRQVE